MSRTVVAFAVLLLAVAAGAQAQVYRCKGQTLYTDKACSGAKPVDVRLNLLDAGPRGFPPQPVPSADQAVVLPNPRPVEPTESSGSVWDNRSARDAAYKSRTNAP